ncbi:hypothetical protein FCH28_28690 [Streptomyces piniterrae]|uniref:Uncharacterized protein n=1 Tax=Streptomyces piniterrae TaxID=2571125 RepID=A0A4U0MW47_9ACTN|nr:hypothetical protein [Streptomyces piniterrae]TJZ45321.1 hypothetical protein FCH28_28690 [Streptomyces piniterrae]
MATPNQADAIDSHTEWKSEYATSQMEPSQIPSADASFAASYCIGPTLNSVTRMLVQRIRQARRGQPPSAQAA